MGRVQNVQNSAAGFVLNIRANIAEVIWLSMSVIVEWIEYVLIILTFKAIHQRRPKNLELRMKEDRRDLRGQVANDHIKTFKRLA